MLECQTRSLVGKYGDRNYCSSLSWLISILVEKACPFHFIHVNHLLSLYLSLEDSSQFDMKSYLLNLSRSYYFSWRSFHHSPWFAEPRSTFTRRQRRPELRIWKAHSCVDFLDALVWAESIVQESNPWANMTGSRSLIRGSRGRMEWRCIWWFCFSTLSKCITTWHPVDRYLQTDYCSSWREWKVYLSPALISFSQTLPTAGGALLSQHSLLQNPIYYPSL